MTTHHTTCTTCGTTHDSGMDETVDACPACPPRRSVSVILSAANMGPDATEADFDAWASYVSEHIDAAFGVSACVDQGDGPRDDIACDGPHEEGDETLCDEIRRWLSNEGWEAFCAESSAA